jgi:hypothetical protein
MEGGAFFASGTCVDDPTVSCASSIGGSEFSTPAPIAELMTSKEEDDASLTGDLLELYLLSDADLYVATRATTSEPFSTAVPVAELNSTLTELRPCVSTDGLSIFFARRLDGAQRHDDIFFATRSSRGAAWGPPQQLSGEINTAADELPTWVSPDGLVLVYEAGAVGAQHDLFVTRRADRTEAFPRGMPLAAINSPMHDGAGTFDASGTIFMFETRRASSSTEIWEAFLDGTQWRIVPHPELAAPNTDGTPWISPDGRTLVFSSNRLDVANDDLFIATR